MKSSSLSPSAATAPAASHAHQLIVPKGASTVVQATAGVRYQAYLPDGQAVTPVRQGDDLVLDTGGRQVRVRGFFKTCADGACSIELPLAAGGSELLTGDSAVAEATGDAALAMGENGSTDGLMQLAEGPAAQASDAGGGGAGGAGLAVAGAATALNGAQAIGLGILILLPGAAAAGSSGVNSGGDNTAPGIGGVALTDATGAQNGQLNAGDVVLVTVTLSEEVTVSGTPRLTLDVGGVPVAAEYLSGSGTNTLTFSYTIQAGDTDVDGISIAANSLLLNGGLILDSAGNAVDLAHLAVLANPDFVVDTTAPAAPVINTVAGDNVVSAAEQTATLSGTAEANATIALGIGGNTRTVTANGSGNWSYTLTAADIIAMGQGAETISVTATDSAGNTGTAGTRTITVDTQVPAAPTIDTVAGDDIVSAAEQNATLSGTAEANATVNISIGGTVRTVTADGSGNWSYDLGAADITAMGQGAETISVTATDAAGNTSVAATRDIDIDTVAPDAPVIGTVAGDDVINNSEQATTITGTAEAGATIDLTIGGNVRTVTADGSGNWSYTLVAADITAMGEGGETLSVTATDAVGNTSAPGTRTISVDTQAPGAPTINTVAGNDVINSGEQTATITGTAEANATVNLSIGGNVRTVTADGSGNWSYTLIAADITAMGQGAETLSATVTDAAGNTGTATTRGISVDTQAPGAPTINAVATDDIINAAEQGGTVAVTGTAEANATVNLSIGGNVRTVTADGSGNWSYTLVAGDYTAMGEGAETLSVTATDTNGNTGTATTRDISIDTQAPGAPTINAVATDDIVNNSEQTASITGTAEANATVNLSIGGNVRTVTADGSGNWSYTLIAADITAMSQGAETLSATVTDAAGNTGTATTRGISVDTQAPGAPTINAVATDDIISQHEVTASITGTAEANATVNLSIGGNVRTVTADGSGNWSYTLVAADITAMGEGAETLSATVTDAAGNTGTATTRDITVNTTNAVDLLAVAAGNGGFVINPQAAGEQSGFSVASAGDVNGDGLDDLIVGAPYANPDGLSIAGRSYVVFGKADGTAVELADIESGSGGFAIIGTLAGELSGFAVSGAGDVNGDGLADLIIGAEGHDSYTGRAYVVFGKADGTAVDLADIAAGNGGFIIDGLGTTDRLGGAVSAAGDVNGDGLDDLIIGANGSDSPAGWAAGMTYVVFGKADGAAVTHADIESGTGGFAIAGEVSGGYSGYAVSGGGDINGDGLADLIVSAYAVQSNTGKTYVVFGKADGGTVDLADIAAGNGGFALIGEGTSNYSGYSVDAAGDVNGDGLDDLVVTAPNIEVDGTGQRAGRSYVVFGKDDGSAVDLADIAAGTGGFVINGGIAYGYSGYWAAGAGDVNGDGLDDLVIGAPYVSAGDASWLGEAYVVFGKTDGTAVNLADVAAGTGGFVINGLFDGDNLGFSVSGAGDVNGDGFADLIIGAPNADINEGDDSGKSYVIFGGSAGYTYGIVDFLGTTGNDTLTGTSADEQFVGGAGNDTITGNGGKDVMYGGAGDDTFVLDADNVASLSRDGNDASSIMRIDGGTGFDTLALAGAGTALAFSAIPGTRVTGIDAIDITGTGDNHLQLDYTDLLRLTDSNRLYVRGNAGDTVTMLGATLTASGIDVGGVFYDAYDLGGDATADVWVEQGVTVNTSNQVALADVAAGTGGYALTGLVQYASFGADVAMLGDLNGDGLDDYIVTSSQTPWEAAANAGRAYVVFGTADGTPPDLAAIEAGTGGGYMIYNTVADNMTGSLVASVGDMNGDGLDDVLLINGQITSRAYVVFGKADGTAVNLADVESGNGGFLIDGTSVPATLNQSISGAGDVNGDGFDDLILYAQGAGERAYVIFGKADSTAVSLGDIAAGTGGFMIVGENSLDLQWGRVSSAGDVNGDGLDDLLVGAPRFEGNTSGRAYVVFGKTDGTAVDLDDIALGNGGFAITPQLAGESLGSGLTAIGDVNGDGHADVAVSAIFADPNGEGNAGKVYVVFGKADGMAVDLGNVSAGSGGFVINGVQADDEIGDLRRISSAGDINGDGLDDLIVSSSDATPGTGFYAGKTYVVFGKTDGAAVNLSDVEAGIGGFMLFGEATFDRSGYAVSGGGDINGDGFDDLLVTAYAGATWFGKAYIVYGGSAGYTVGIVDHLGGDGDDVLTGYGSSSNEQFVAGAGNDTLIGNGGKDVMYGGAGDDTFVLNASNVTNLADNSNKASAIMRVDGGNGTDTLQLSGSNIVLDFTAIADGRVTGIDVIDLGVGSNNELVLNYTDLLALTDSRTLLVQGTDTGTVDIGGATLVTGGVDIGGVLYDSYNLGGTASADIWVQQGITVVV